MRKKLFLMLLLTSSMAMAQKLFLGSPNGRLEVMIEMNGGVATYTVYYDGFQVIQPSQLGFEADFGDFTKDLSFKEKIGADTLNLVPLGVSDQTVNLKYKKLKHSKYSTCKQFTRYPVQARIPSVALSVARCRRSNFLKEPTRSFVRRSAR